MTREEAVIILDGFKNNPLFSDTHAQALDMAISALSAEGEYIKKTDILNELGDTNMDILTDEVKEIVNGLRTYTFPDSAENKCFNGMTNGEVFQAIFPCDEVLVNGLQEGIVHFSMKSNLDSLDCFELEWWNAPYKAESEDEHGRY